MKTSISVVSLFILFVLSSCTKQEQPSTVEASIAPTSKARTCIQEALLQQIKKDPVWLKRYTAIENFQPQQASAKIYLPTDTIFMYVQVNICYNNGPSNITDAQVISQIGSLNADYNGTNPEFIPDDLTIYNPLKAKALIKCILLPIKRRLVTTSSWTTANLMKTAASGIAPTRPDSVLNIWVVNNLSGGLLAYTQLPGGPVATEGIVIIDEAFGTIGSVVAPFNKGRTLIHEMGHWLNLKHIWGDAPCGNDFCGDTPLHNTANYGVPIYPHYSTCTGTPIEMTQNFMDLVDDVAMYMFTPNQVSRMRATFGPGGFREAYGF
ncbi:pregnancy-associated plasma protein-A [Chitinophaga skermanii]|uniref:Pregnancy-associated plasma protein-A n=1 Tax=Chitinophaga skermanii TaxID=331697 RepID=A0A327Q943_9BACT|nr:M43 family zinc metalloprotease [Chitinophaga skermanii]RAJ00404.1 pregnancy-associated plasma protein-A [Chitinophaga skermanii]